MPSKVSIVIVTNFVTLKNIYCLQVLSNQSLLQALR